MTAPNDIERDLTRWMSAVVPKQAPDHLAPSVVVQTRSMRPRPGWLVRLLEPSMQTQLSLRNSLGFPRSPRLILVALLVLALLVGGIFVGSQLIRSRSLPPPFGPAANGLLATNFAGQIVLLEPDGSNVRRLALPFDGITRTSFSRSGTRFAAWGTPDTSGSEKSLIVANADGSGAFEVDPATLVGDPGAIDWSPEDRRLAFSGSTDRLFVADTDTRKVTELSGDQSITFRRDPAWGPDGRLAYKCMTADSTPFLCVMSADFRVEQRLRTSAGTEYAFQEPSWSRDGTLIAYQVDDTIDHVGGESGWDVATIDVATGTERILTRGFVDHAILPAWSPDDEHLLFLTENGPGVVRSDGTDVRVLGQASCAWMGPSPDGAFAACASGTKVILFPIEGAGQPTVLDAGGPVDFVNWQRKAL